MELPVFFLFAVEEKKRVYEKRQVGDKGDIKRTVFIENFGGYFKYVGKV